MKFILYVILILIIRWVYLFYKMNILNINIKKRKTNSKLKDSMDIQDADFEEVE